MLSLHAPSLRFSIGLAILFHLLAAHFSVGAWHPDEHFQLLEFLNLKLGGTDSASLPWEYGARLRPWLPVALLRALTEGWRLVGVRDPFLWAESFRIFASGLALAGVWATLRLVRETAPRERAEEFTRWAAFAFAGLWFLPFLHARISSEAMAASFFALTLPSLGGVTRGRRALFWGGICLGLSFECRFQMGIMIVGALVWLGRERRLRDLVPMTLGFMLVFALGRVADRWGYGEWTLTPWNYLRTNLFEGKAQQWGTLPAWGYLYLLGRVLLPLGALGLAALFVFWWRQPRHLLTWVSAPFFLVHSLIAHKEARFLAPIAWFLPAMLPFVWPKGKPRTTHRLAFSLLVAPLLALNFYALLWLSLKPALPDARFWERAVERFPNGFRVSIGPNAKDPYEWAQLPVSFFRAGARATLAEGERLVYLWDSPSLREGDEYAWNGRACRVIIDALGPFERALATHPFTSPKNSRPLLLDCGAR